MEHWLQVAMTELKNMHYGCRTGEADEFIDCAVESLQAMADSRACDPVWRALERRADPAALLSSQLASNAARDFAKNSDPEMMPEHPVRPLPEHCLRSLQPRAEYPSVEIRPSRNLSDMARMLAMTVAEIRTSPIPRDTVGARKEKLKQVERAVETLKSALDAIWGGNNLMVDFTAREIGPLCDFSARQVNKWLCDLEMIGVAKVDAESAAVAYRASFSTVSNPRGYLNALAEEARVWASETPELANPNDPNAARLLFIRRLTAFFREDYGEPLRACVLAVTSVFFECESLDESAIAKLAP